MKGKALGRLSYNDSGNAQPYIGTRVEQSPGEIYIIASTKESVGDSRHLRVLKKVQTRPNEAGSGHFLDSK